MTADKRFFKYLKTGEEEKRWGMYVTGAGHIQVPRETTYPFVSDPQHHYFHFSMGRRLTDYQIIYITKGRGIFESEVSGKHEIKAGDAFVLFPDVWHTFKPDEETGWDEYWVEFNGDLVEHFVQNNYLQPENPVISIGISNQVASNYLKIIAAIKEEKPGHQYITSGIVVQLLGQIISAIKFQSLEGREIEDKIKLARLKMLENLEMPIKQEDLAQSLGLGYSVYRKKFKEYTGLSPAQYHIQLRIQTAKDLLTTTNMSIKEIAHKLSFNNKDYFFRLFKQKTGCTLSEYREQNLG